MSKNKIWFFSTSNSFCLIASQIFNTKRTHFLLMQSNQVGPSLPRVTMRIGYNAQPYYTRSIIQSGSHCSLLLNLVHLSSIVLTQCIYCTTGCILKKARDPECTSCFLDFKLSYLKHLKLFWIQVKELYEPVVCKEKLTGLCSF